MISCYWIAVLVLVLLNRFNSSTVLLRTYVDRLARNEELPNANKALDSIIINGKITRELNCCISKLIVYVKTTQ